MSYSPLASGVTVASASTRPPPSTSRADRPPAATSPVLGWWLSTATSCPPAARCAPYTVPITPAPTISIFTMTPRNDYAGSSVATLIPGIIRRQGRRPYLGSRHILQATPTQRSGRIDMAGPADLTRTACSVLAGPSPRRARQAESCSSDSWVGAGPGFGYSLLRMATWQSSGSFRSAALAAIRTPIQASAKPYAAAHGTSTGIRAADGSELVRAAATITGLAATATQARVPRTPPSP